MVQCCAPLLYKWFLSDLPSERSFIQNKDNLKWSHRIMSLTAANISWYSHIYDDIQMIVNCRNFPNVSLIEPEVASITIEMSKWANPYGPTRKAHILQGFFSLALQSMLPIRAGPYGPWVSHQARIAKNFKNIY